MMKRTNGRGGIGKNILIGCGILFVVGVVLIGVVMFLGYRAVKSRVVTEPAEVEARARRIMDYEIPGGSRGIMAADFGFKVAMVQGTNPPEVQLVLASMPGAWLDSPEKKTSMEQQLHQNLGKNEEMVVEKMETKDGTLCGQPVKVTMKRGYLAKNGERRPMHSMQGLVRHGEQGLFVLVIGKEPGQLEAVFASLKCRG